MIFYKLNSKHKKYFIINKSIVILALIIMFFQALSIEGISLENNVEKMGAGVGFVMITLVLVLALSNRIASVFKIKSIGFLILFLLFLGIENIISSIRLATGLMMIPLLIDDIVFRPIWLNIWYNQYDNLVRIENKWVLN